MSLAEIYDAIPHREPFLLIDEIVQRSEKQISCRKTFHGTEYFFAGQYPHFPIVPGVLLCEAAMQAGAVLLAQYVPQDAGAVLPVAAKLSEVRFKRMVRPGETIDIEVELTDRVSNAFFLAAKVTCQGELAARLECTCMITPVPSE
jgi:3-hydroxyacyl-[acyl-carrier-protein] dehydratase